jgi:hypothetical protein
MLGIFAQILTKKQTEWNKKEVKIGMGCDKALYSSNPRYKSIFKHLGVLVWLRPNRRDISNLKEHHLVGSSIFDVIEEGLNNYTILLTLQKFQKKNRDLGIGMSIYIEGRKLNSAELKDLIEGIRKGEIW